MDSRFSYVPCILLRQFKKTFTPYNRKFRGEMDQNLLILINFKKTRAGSGNVAPIVMGMVFLEMA